MSSIISKVRRDARETEAKLPLPKQNKIDISIGTIASVRKPFVRHNIFPQVQLAEDSKSGTDTAAGSEKKSLPPLTTLPPLQGVEEEERKEPIVDDDLVDDPPPPPPPVDKSSQDRGDQTAIAGIANLQKVVTFRRRRVFPRIRVAPQVANNYEVNVDNTPEKMLKLIIKVQAAVRGMLVRSKLRREWKIQASYERKRLLRKFKASVLVVQLSNERRRKRRRSRRRRAKSEDEQKSKQFPSWFLWLTYTVASVWMLLCGLYVVAVALSFGPTTTTKWLSETSGATFVWEPMIQDPFKIGIIVLFAEYAEIFVDVYYEVMDFMPFQI